MTNAALCTPEAPCATCAKSLTRKTAGHSPLFYQDTKAIERLAAILLIANGNAVDAPLSGEHLTSCPVIARVRELRKERDRLATHGRCIGLLTTESLPDYLRPRFTDGDLFIGERRTVKLDPFDGGMMQMVELLAVRQPSFFDVFGPEIQRRRRFMTGTQYDYVGPRRSFPDANQLCAE